MVSIFKYSSMPNYLNKMRDQVRIKGSKKIKTYEDDKNCLIGFMDGEDIYCVNVKTAREYYYALFAGAHNLLSPAELYGNDVLKILNSNNLKNKNKNKNKKKFN